MKAKSISTRLPASPPFHWRFSLASRQAMIAYLFLAPAIVYFGIFFFYPIGLEFWVSLQQGQPLVGESHFVGLDNYLRALTDTRVIESFKVTVIFAIENTLANIILGMGLALLLNQPLKGRTALRAFVFFPYMTTFVIVALMWRNILEPYSGLLNGILGLLGLPGQDWLINYQTTLPTVMGITAWHSMGYNMILFLAGLQGIPDEYREAAMIDGANRWQQFRYITLPLLAPTTLFVSIIALISSLQAFAQPYLITNGGPADATRFFVYHVFNTAFGNFDFGYSSALAFLMFIFILILTIVQYRLGDRGVEY